MSDMTTQNAIYCMKAMLCEEVCEDCDYYGKTGTDHCEADAIRMAIKALEEQPRWTPCSKGLPEVRTTVLVTKKPFKIKGYEQEVVKAKRSVDPRSGKIEWWSPEFGTLIDKVVLAWMPLPEPYRGESNE